MDTGPFEWLRQRELTASYVYHYPPVWNYLGVAGIVVGLAAITQAYCQNQSESIVTDRRHVETLDALNRLDSPVPNGPVPQQAAPNLQRKSESTRNNAGRDKNSTKSASKKVSTEKKTRRKNIKMQKRSSTRQQYKKTDSGNRHELGNPEVRKALPPDEDDHSLSQ